MKKLFILSLLSVLSRPVDANTILGMSVYPVAPTSQDTVYAILECAFNSGGCEMVAGGVTSINGNQIELSANHCTGLLTVICYETDTISLGVLPAGNYVLNANLLVGMDSASSGNCDMFAQVDQDVFAFTVAPFTGLSPEPFRTPVVTFSKGPQALQVDGPIWPVRIALMDAAGRLLHESVLQEPGQLDLSGLPAGIYLYSVSSKDGVSVSGKIALD